MLVIYPIHIPYPTICFYLNTFKSYIYIHISLKTIFPINSSSDLFQKGYICGHPFGRLQLHEPKLVELLASAVRSGAHVRKPEIWGEIWEYIGW